MAKKEKKVEFVEMVFTFPELPSPTTFPMRDCDIGSFKDTLYSIKTLEELLHFRSQFEFGSARAEIVEELIRHRISSAKIDVPFKTILCVG